MAITIETQPSTDYLYPAYNPIQYLVDSNKTSEDNFKVYAYVYRDPSSDNELIATRRMPIRPGTTNVYFDASKAIQDYLADSLSSAYLANDYIGAESGMWDEFRVVFREYYGNPPLLYMSGSGQTNTIVAYNGSVKYTEWLDPNLSSATSYPNWKVVYDYNTGNSTGNPFLTSWDNYHTGGTDGPVTVTGLDSTSNFVPLQVGQKMTLRWRRDNPTSLNSVMYVIALDEDFSENHKDTVSSSTDDEQGISVMQIGTDELDAMSGLSFTINTDDKYLAFCLSGGGGGRGSCFLLYELIHDPCDKYTNYEIHWLNRFGGFDSYVFNGRPYKNEMTTRETYLTDQVTITQDTITNSLHAKMNGVHHTTVKQKHKLNSKIIKPWMAEGFKDLFSSPLVYWNHPDYGIMQIRPTQTDYAIKNAVGDKAFNIQFEFEIDHKDTRQRI